MQNIGGLALAYWIEYFAYLDPNHEMAWRTPLALQIIFILVIGWESTSFQNLHGGL